MRRRWVSREMLPVIASLSLLVTASGDDMEGPTARLSQAPRLVMPGAVDSNNPAVWDLHDGLPHMFVVTSWGGTPSLSIGPSLDRLPRGEPVTFEPHPGHGVWLEAIIPDEQGSWYAYYHHETPAEPCGRLDRFIPRIGAARSTNQGRTWQDLGFIIEAPKSSYACTSANRFVLGGVGDVTAALDADAQNVYLFFSQYAKDAADQGVAVARLAWADRDRPVGRAAIWNDGAWIPARERRDSSSGAETAENEDREVGGSWEYPLGTVLVPATRPWHDANPAADAYWGPAVHWNTYLEQYVMLVNRARDEAFNQDGIYVSFAATLADPRSWSAPVKVMTGGGWYAQVVGLGPDGTDKRAGQRARFFNTGRSEHFIEFER